MNIHWVNHASFITELPGFRMISDPWMEGRVFNRSWAHLLPSKFSYADFNSVNYIWFSHEHPDHFFPPNLQKIDAQDRAGIQVLYQKTKDAKVADYCRKAGFGRVLDLSPWQPMMLPEGVEVLNAKVRNDTDSWMVLKAEGKTLVNVNDCVFGSDEELERIAQAAGPVDVLFTQFSFASWVGNPDDPESLRKAAREKFEEVRRQVRLLKPRFVVPFASYVWFCHRDNFFMNAYANTVQDMVNLLTSLGVTPVVLAPGDSWQTGSPWNNEPSLARYQDAVEALSRQPELTIPQTFSMAQLTQSAMAWQQKGLSRNSAFKLRQLPAARFWVNDWNQAVELSYLHGLKPVNLDEQHCDVSLCSDSLKYCLDFDWGWDTIQIAGTFSKPKGGNFRHFEEFQWVGNLNNQGKRLDHAVVRLFKNLVPGLAK